MLHTVACMHLVLPAFLTQNSRPSLFLPLCSVGSEEFVDQGFRHGLCVEVDAMETAPCVLVAQVHIFVLQ